MMRVQCCVVGGGPAGMMLGFLMARAGLETLVIEKHADFLRDFRGDTVHPSTLQIMDELGLLDDFLKRPHQKLDKMVGQFGRQTVRIADLSGLKIKCPYIAFMPQWEFLDFLFEQGARFPNLKVLRSTEAVDLVREDETIVGVSAIADGAAEIRTGLDIRADLTVGCDGRHSTIRQRANLPVENIGAPIDVLWFRIGKSAGRADDVFMHAEAGRILVTLDRDDYWQCAYVIPKGELDSVKARGLDQFRQDIAISAPALRDHVNDVKDWNDVKLLTVTIDRLTRWTRPGLLCIGDAAHAMSPVGGVGINLAIQDAVATANILAAQLSRGCPGEDQLDKVRQRRLFPTKFTQAMQVQMHNRIIFPALGQQDFQPPLALRMIDKAPWLQGLVARLIGVGIRPEHVQSPMVSAGSGMIPDRK
jgi:2-polyprenyl-6-methoxyphenol hydroxylase-like FAD-dependent oxidoreductase